MGEDDDDDDKEVGHFGSKSLDKLHIRIKDTDDGACLTGHDYNYSNRNNKFTCNYRYQAWEHAWNNSAIKDRLHDYPTRSRKKIETSAPEGGKYGHFPARYFTEIAAPGPKDWHLDGPSEDISRTA